MSPVNIDADEVETYLAKPDVPVGVLSSSSHQRHEKKRRRSSTDTDNNPMCVGQVHHNARALVVSSAAAPVILSQLSRCSVAKTLNRNPLVRNLGDENDARSIRARVQQLLIHVVMLPVVWVSVCCVVTAAMGIGCVESLQSRLLVSAPTDARTDTNADDGNQRPTKKAKRSIRENDRDSGRQRLTRVHHRDEKHQDDDEDQSAIIQKKKMKKTNATEPVETTDDANKTCDPLLGAHLLANTQRAPRQRKRRVIIWDLDETLVLFASLCSGQFARTHGRDVATSVALGEQMMTYLLAVLERHFYFSDLHDADVDHITTATATEPNDLQNGAVKGSPEYAAVVAERYTHIRAIYDRHRAVDFLDDSSSQWFAARHALVAAIDGFSAGWIKEAKEILTLTSAQRPAPTKAASSPVTDTEELEEQDEVINVMVTNTQLSPALCKCLIYGIDQFFPIDCVYSSTKLHKMRCFQTIIAKYSKDSGTAGVVDRDVEFLAVGDGMEEEQVSRALGLGFFKIRSLHDLQQLRYELQLAPRPQSSVATSPKPLRTPSPAATTVAAE